MKKLLAILVLFVAFKSFGQHPTPPPGPNVPPSSVDRATIGNVVVDQRLRAATNMYVPQYQDTTSANTPYWLGQDSCGAMIYTYDVNTIWVRACSPKRWSRISGGFSLPDGVYSGGNVAWSGTGLVFNVSASTYVLGGIFYTCPGGTVTLDPADATFDRRDAIILDSTCANKITGVASANPQDPSVNPQGQIARAYVTIPANSPTPAITTNILFDENLGQPTEWDATSTGTVVFGNLSFPYHLTIAAAVNSLNDGETITFSTATTYNNSEQGSMVIFVRLGSAWDINQNININLLFNGNIVGRTLNFTTYGLANKTLINTYIPIIVPMPDFSSANIQFNGVQLTAVGDLPTFNLDYIQFQTGFTPVFQQQNTFTSVAGLTDGSPLADPIIATTPTTQLNIDGINNITVIPNNTTKTLTISGINLIRNDLLYGSPQPTSGVWVDNHINITNTAVQDNILSIEGKRSSIGLAQFIDDNAGGNGPIGGYSIHPIARFLAANMIDGHAASLYLGKAYTTDGNMVLQYVQKNIASAGKGVAFTITPFGRNDIEFWFYGDSSFVIGNHDVKNDRYKLDVPNGMARFNGVEIRTYQSKGASVTDSSYIWKAYLDSVLTAKGSGTVTSIATNTGSGITGGTITTTGTLAIDTTIVATRAYAGNLVTTYFNSNVGSSFRLAIPGTNNIKTLASGYSLTWDSATSNTLRITIDTTLMATRAYVGAAGGAGTVSAVSFNNTNGFGGSWSNPTTTPQLTLTTTITGLLKGNGTAMSAATSGTDYSAGTSGLATGIIKSTTTTGAFTIAVAGDFPTLNQNTTGTASNVTGTVLVANGGTGRTTNTAYALMAAGTTATGAMQQVSGVGTTGQVLTSNGAAALPTWQTPVVTSGVASITGTANQVIASAATGAVTLSLPQSIATTSAVTFGRLTVGGTAATSPLTFITNTDATATAGRWFYNTTRLGFSLATTIQRVVLTTDAAPANGALAIGNGTGFQNGFLTAGDNGTVVTNSAGGIAVRENSTFQTLTSGATITWNAANGYNANITLANVGATLNITNPVDGRSYMIVITQDGTGSRTITTWPAGTLWPLGAAPTLSTVAGAINVVVLTRRGTNYIGEFNPNRYQ